MGGSHGLGLGLSFGATPQLLALSQKLICATGRVTAENLLAGLGLGGSLSRVNRRLHISGWLAGAGRLGGALVTAYRPTAHQPRRARWERSPI